MDSIASAASAAVSAGEQLVTTVVSAAAPRSKSKSKFRDDFTFAKRLEVSTTVLRKHPDHVPVVVERAESEHTLAAITQKKFLIYNDATVGKLLFEVRKNVVALQPHQALFLFIVDGDNPNAPAVLPSASATMSDIYRRYKNADGFVYAVYSGETCFGFE